MADGIMECFYGLAEDELQRIKATKTLIGKLQTATDVSVDYAWKRLVKGMSSNRKQARKGFSLALTELLSTFPKVTSEEVYEHSLKSNIPTGHVSQKEIRDLYTGFIFCVSALYRSGRLKNNDLQLKVMSDLLPILMKRKLTIKDIVFKIYLDIMDDIEDNDMKNVIELHRDELIKGWELCTLERLVLCAYFEMRSASSMSKILKKHWNFSHLNHPQNYEKISAILQTVVCEDYMKPQLKTYISCCMKSGSFSTKKASKYFFTISQSGENKNTVIYMILQMVSSVPEKNVSHFINRNIVSYLRKSYESSPDSIQNLTTTVIDRVSKIESMDIKFELTSNMISNVPHRSSCLHKVISALLTSVKKDDVGRFMTILQTHYICPPGDKSAKIISDFRIDCLAWMNILCRQCDSKAILEYTKFLFIYSFFSVKGECITMPKVKIPIPEMSKETIEFSKTKFNSCLKMLSSSPADKNTKRRGLAEDGRYWVYHLLSSSLSLVTNESFPMINDITEEKEWQSLWFVIDEVEAKPPDSRSDEEWAFELLFLHAGILFFEEQQQAKVILGDVYQCYEKHKNGSQENWKSVFVDLLISLLSYESLMLRNIACDCFRFICHNLDQDSIDLIMGAVTSTGETVDNDDSSEDVAESDQELNEEDAASEQDSESEGDDDKDDSEDAEEHEEIEGVDDKMEDEEDINLSDADEEVLENDDKALGLAMKGLLEMRKAKQQQKKEKALKKVKIVHFKVKILDFVEILIENVGFSMSTMNILPGLLELLNNPSHNTGPLYNRVLGIFKNMFNMKSEKLKIDFQEALKCDIPKIQRFILKTSNKKSQQLAAQSLFLVCKVYLHTDTPKKKKRKSNAGKSASKEEEVYSVFTPILENFLSTKNTKLDKNTFFQMIERFHGIRYLMISDLADHLEKDITLYAKTQCVALISRILSFADEKVLDCHEHVLKHIIQFTSFLVESANPSPHHVREPLKICQKLYSVAQRKNIAVAKPSEQFSSVLNSVVTSGVAASYPDIGQLASKIVKLYTS